MNTIIRYGLVGLAGFGSSWLLFEFYSNFLIPGQYVAASLLAFFTWAPFGYLLHGRFVFRSGAFERNVSILRFAAWISIYLLQPLSGSLILIVSMNALGIEPRIAYLLAAMITSTVSFIASRTIFVVWKRHRL